MRFQKTLIILLLITSSLTAMDWWGDDLKEQRRKAQQEREQKELDDRLRKAFATEQLKEYAWKLTVPYHIQYPPAFTESFVKILQNGADPNARIITRDGFNQPVLIIALLSHSFYPQIIKALLDAGANPNAKSIVGTPALSIAAAKGQVDIVKLLLEKQALVDLPDQFGETALISAIKSGHDLNTQTNLIKLLIDNGANVEYTTPQPNNFTPLTLAIIGPMIQPDNRIPLVSLLLEMGADPNRGVSPLTLALSDKNSDRRAKLVQLLLQAGADPNLPYNGLSPLEYARSKRLASDIQDFDQWSQIIEWLEKPETAPRLVPKVKLISTSAAEKKLEEHRINQEVEGIQASEEYKKSAQEAAEKHLEQLKKIKEKQ